MFLVSLAVCPCFNFQTKTWHPALCLSGSQTPQGRPATATVSSWEKLTLDAPIRGRPSLSLPPSFLCPPPCACARTCSLASCRLLCHHHPRCPFFSSASAWPALARASGAAPACLSPPDSLLPPTMGKALLFWTQEELGMTPEKQQSSPESV